MKFIYVQSVLPQKDVIALKKKTRETSVKEAIYRAVYHYLKCDLVDKDNEDDELKVRRRIDMVTLEDAKKLMENEINRAKKLLTIGPGIESPIWLEATPEHSFGKEDHMVRIFVLEGSPPKGYILADYTHGLVKTLRGTDLRTIKTYKAYKRGETLGLDRLE